MQTKKKAILVGAAVAGILGAISQAHAGEPIPAHKLKKTALVPCYGINSCKATGDCSGENHGCGGHNSCKGSGWLAVPKDACLKIPGGSLTPPAAAASDKK
ncbi:MAG: hypothetical protein JST92_03800 [Deltaproteobacteria bacterium]|nr:hypothetical protein [Deltaproteobacteria bacterium]